MANPWREAYLRQARSDYETFKQLTEAHLCHRLHYLQMATEKMAKGFLCDPSGPDRPKNVHQAFSKFMRVARTIPRLSRVCGFPPSQFKMYLESLTPLAAEIEALAPTGPDHPNPEYPWEENGVVVVPVEYAFPNLSLARPKMLKMLEFIGRCFEIA